MISLLLYFDGDIVQAARAAALILMPILVVVAWAIWTKKLFDDMGAWDCFRQE
jgi:hypothetical protein